MPTQNLHDHILWAAIHTFNPTPETLKTFDVELRKIINEHDARLSLHPVCWNR